MTRFVSIFLLMLSLTSVAYADVLDLLRAGLAARNRGDMDAAIHYLTQAIETGKLSQSDLATVTASRGVAHDAKGATAKAIADFDAAIGLEPRFGEAYIYRGLAWQKVRDYQRAISDFTEAARVAPRGAFLALMNRGNVYGDMGENDRAIADYTEAIRLNADYPTSYYNRGSAYQEMEEFEKAIADFDAAIRLRPGFAEAALNRAGAYLAMGDLGQAIIGFDKAIGDNPRDATAFGNRGIAHMAKGDYARALTDFDEAVRLKPDNVRGYGNRGIARFYAGQRRAAVEDFAHAIQLWPASTAMVIWLHVAQARAGQDDRQEFARRAANLDQTGWPYAVIGLHLGVVSPDNFRATASATGNVKPRRKLICEIDFHLGMFHLEQGRNAEARSALQSAAETCSAAAIERTAAKAELAALADGAK